MKFNWGTGIVLAFIGFIGFILFLVITMTVNNKFSYDLVTEGYYQKELEFEDRFDAKKNTWDFEEKVNAIREEKGLLIYFPKNLDYKNIKGKVFLYRPSNKQLDFEMPISISDNYLLVPENRLLDGRWNISVEWKYKNKNYLHEQEITF